MRTNAVVVVALTRAVRGAMSELWPTWTLTGCGTGSLLPSPA